jgi:CRP-like cAMP-binding protein
MVAKHANTLTTITDKLQSLGTLDQSDRDALGSLVFTVNTAPANHDLVKQGEVATNLQVLLDGYACRYKITAEGARQIVSFHVPGDILDAQQLLLGCADHFVQTITSATIGVVPLTEFRRILKLRPNVAEAVWRDTLIDASIYREWVLNVGKRDVTSRIAHMLCEFAFRRENARLGPPERCELPMTQHQIADATGLSAVHVNRALHELARSGVIASDKPEVEIIDWLQLSRIADFDPSYLHGAG